jgi:hypothetical protein
LLIHEIRLQRVRVERQKREFFVMPVIRAVLIIFISICLIITKILLSVCSHSPKSLKYSCASPFSSPWIFLCVACIEFWWIVSLLSWGQGFGVWEQERDSLCVVEWRGFVCCVCQDRKEIVQSGDQGRSFRTRKGILIPLLVNVLWHLVRR